MCERRPQACAAAAAARQKLTPHCSHRIVELACSSEPQSHFNDPVKSLSSPLAMTSQRRAPRSIASKFRKVICPVLPLLRDGSRERRARGAPSASLSLLADTILVSAAAAFSYPNGCSSGDLTLARALEGLVRARVWGLLARGLDFGGVRSTCCAPWMLLSAR